MAIQVEINGLYRTVINLAMVNCDKNGHSQYKSHLKYLPAINYLTWIREEISLVLYIPHLSLTLVSFGLFGFLIFVWNCTTSILQHCFILVCPVLFSLFTFVLFGLFLPSFVFHDHTGCGRNALNEASPASSKTQSRITIYISSQSLHKHQDNNMNHEDHEFELSTSYLPIISPSFQVVVCGPRPTALTPPQNFRKNHRRAVLFRCCQGCLGCLGFPVSYCSVLENRKTVENHPSKFVDEREL